MSQRNLSRKKASAPKGIAALRRFGRASNTPGPHLIPRNRQIKNEFHRVFSPKAGFRDVELESALETAALYWFEGTPTVVSVCEQSPRIHAPIANASYYTFDFTVTYNTKKEILYETKPEIDLLERDDGRLVPKDWDAIEYWCEANGRCCEILTDVNLAPHKQLIKNWRKLLPFVRCAYENPDLDLDTDIKNMTMRADRITIARLAAEYPSKSAEIIYAHVAMLLHRSELFADLKRERVSTQTKIWCE